MLFVGETGLSIEKKIVLVYIRLEWLLVLTVAFNNIAVISLRSVLLMEETELSGENHRPAASHGQTLSQNVVSCTCRHEGH